VNLFSWNRGPFREGDPGDGGNGGGGDPPAFTPTFEGALQPDGSFSEGWHTKAFGSDYSGPLAQAKTVADVDKMLRDNMAAARAKTEGMVRVPGDDAKPEDLAAFRKALGVPDDPTGYGLVKPETLPDGVAWDDAYAAEFGKTAHELGLTAKQAAKLTEFQTQRIAAQVAQAREEIAKSLEAEKADLAKRFNGDTNAVNAAVAAAQKVGAKVGLPPNAFDPADKDYWGNEALAAFAKLSAQLGEHGFTPGSGNPGAMSVDEAKAIMGNKDHPLHKKWAEGDKEVHARIDAAYRAATGGK